MTARVPTAPLSLLLVALSACSSPPAVPAASPLPGTSPPAPSPSVSTQPASPASSAAPATVMDLFGPDPREKALGEAAMNAPAVYTSWSMASANDLSRDDMLFYRGYSQDLSPRRCDRSSTSVTCVLVHLTSAATLRVDLKNNLTVAGRYGCRPVGFVRTSVQGRRATFHMDAPRMGGGLCRASTPLRGSAEVGPVGPGIVELVADNADIEGVSIAPPPGSP